MRHLHTKITTAIAISGFIFLNRAVCGSGPRWQPSSEDLLENTRETLSLMLLFAGPRNAAYLLSSAEFFA